MRRVAVDIQAAPRAPVERLICRVAATSAEQQRGLEAVERLGREEGMLFPFRPARPAVFWMAGVRYPIDVAFIEPNGVIARVVHAAQPGDRKARWSHDQTAYVLETNGGWFAAHGFRVGARVHVAGAGSSGFDGDLLRALESPADRPSAGDAALGDARLKTQPLESDAPPREHEEGGGTFFIQSHSRCSPGTGLRRWAQATPNVDVTRLFPALLEGAARMGGVTWKPTILNPYRDQAVIGPQDIARWLHALGLDEDERSMMHAAATSTSVLDLLGEGFMAADMAETAQVVPAQQLLVLTRRRKGT